MPRRRYRLFTVCALVIVFMLYRVVQNSWDDAPGYGNLREPPQHDPQGDLTHESGFDPSPAKGQDAAAGDKETATYGQSGLADDGVVAPPVDDKDAAKQEFTSEDDKIAAGADDATPEVPGIKIGAGADDATPGDTDTKVGTEKTTTEGGETKAANAVDASHDSPVKEDSEKAPVDDSLWASNPPKGGSDQISADDLANPATKQHWHRPEEIFPIDRLINLPSGTPKKIPKIQFDFGTESEAAKTTRTQRQKRVKIEMERAWAGYKKYAWMHDELSPVSAKYRDPFCGWAATLVDTLDTLWVAGMKEDFDIAAKAVQNIDFTWTPRHDIPVFETTIRYLGGLVAAYDVSGGHDGKYRGLLDKAVELAEILMGIFDTPNRMPLLYYQWKPEFTSQPHRAGRVGIAELATLSMEFTRLAQLTGKDKYYDAVARITDALVELQAAGTAIPGLFPENLDASGCNKTATTLRDSISKQAQEQMASEELLEEPKGFVPSKESDVVSTDKTTTDDDKVEPVAADDRLHRRAALDLEVKSGSSSAPDTTPHDTTRKPPFAANGKTSQWDCVPQGLAPSGTSYQNFHMGGAQDSAYEYFPKEYLLLGGLEPKYQKLHEDTVDAVNEWLLYRPMAADEKWDVLFPAKVSTGGHPQTDISPTFEITHLTCFIGGMYGLGGKIFNRPEDIETAKKLTDGCVWAYQLTPSGLMPEGSRVIPCPTLDRCEFNETLWWEWLDPSREWREGERLKWEKQEEQKALLQSGADEITTKPAGVLGDDRALEEDSLYLNSAGNRAAGAQGKKPSTDDATDEALPRSLGHTNGTSVVHVDANGIGRRSPPQPATSKNTKPLTHEEYVTRRIKEDQVPPGFVDLTSRAYILRPEAIESVWYMYRITGDPTWMDKGWAMFEATVRATRTEIANSAIDDVMLDEPGLKDEMESFWLAETLKYYYLLFSEPDLVSLDEWVLNTEAHPFRRPT